MVKLIKVLLLSGLSLLPCAIGQAQTPGTITTLAGTGELGFGGDGGAAAQAVLAGPNGVTLDFKGNVYFADVNNHRVRKIDPNGIITTVAGHGRSPFSNPIEDMDVPALQAEFGFLLGVETDPQGELLIIVEQARFVRLDSDGYLRAYGPPEGNFDPHFTTDGDYYFTTAATSPQPGLVIYRHFASGQPPVLFAGGGTKAPETGLLATDVLFTSLGILTVDAAGNVYVGTTDQPQHEFPDRIYRISPSGVLTHIAGTGPPPCRPDIQVDCIPDVKPIVEGDLATDSQIAGASSFMVDAAGNLYFAYFAGRGIYKVDPQGIIHIIAGNSETPSYSGDGGPALDAGIGQIAGLIIDADGNIIFCDVGNDRVRKVWGVAAPGVVAGKALPGNGDVNRDGQVKISDAILALQAAVGATPLTPEARAFADTDGSLTLDVSDVTRILRKAVGL